MGARHRRDRDPVQAAESQPRTGGLVAARPGRQARVTARGCAAALRAEPTSNGFSARPRAWCSSGGRIAGLALEDGRVIRCRTLVVTTGTFLNGLVHIGREQRPAGRAGEPPSHGLAESLKACGFRWGRLKTGTPPRLDRREPRLLPFRARRRGRRPAGAVLLSSTDGSIVRRSIVTRCTRPPASTSSCGEHIGQSPLYNGQIKGIGPRYCPSLEDKVMRFPDRERHHLFLEPEGLDVDEIYLNGFSMSLPATSRRIWCTPCPASRTPRF